MDQHAYFEKLNKELKQYKRALPFLIIDLDRLDTNIQTLKDSIDQKLDARLVVKSLPSPELLIYLSSRIETNKYMVFHQPFLSHLTRILNNKSDVLFGKPMPIKTANYFYNNFNLKNDFNPFTQIQWLVDTEKRIIEYIGLAKRLGKQLRLNLEIDVGLHRGGFSNLQSLSNALKIVDTNLDHAVLSGFMGYDPHVVKLPSFLRSKQKAFQLANSFYNECKDLLKENFPRLWNENLTFNGGGSPTVNLHAEQSTPINEVAVGSCLVKPTTFDIPSLENYIPASFIATPVLKQFDKTNLPGPPLLSKLMGMLNRSLERSYFIYGGHWKADYWYPKGIKQNNLFGPSTNQTMINSTENISLNVDDFVFLRPHQSEFVFLQFGNILIFQKGKIIEDWSVLNNT